MTYHALNLNEIRSKDHGRHRKMPFEHQLDAFERMSSTFEFNGKPGKGALLVLPTGAGKTFTAVKWLCDNVICREHQDSLARPFLLSAGSSLQRVLHLCLLDT